MRILKTQKTRKHTRRNMHNKKSFCKEASTFWRFWQYILVRFLLDFSVGLSFSPMTIKHAEEPDDFTSDFLYFSSTMEHTVSLQTIPDTGTSPGPFRCCLIASFKIAFSSSLNPFGSESFTDCLTVNFCIIYLYLKKMNKAK